MLFDCGFGVHCDSHTHGPGVAKLDAEDPQVADDNDLATRIGEYSLALARNRITRMAWLWRCWPGQCVLFSHPDPAVARAAVDRMRRDYEAWQDLDLVGGRFWTKVGKESVFHLPSVKQYVEVFLENGWNLTPAIVELARGRCSGTIQSKVIEDGFLQERRLEQSGVNLITAEESMWHRLVAKRVLCTVHRFTEVSMHDRPQARTASLNKKLPKRYFHPPARGASLDFKPIMGRGSATWSTSGGKNFVRFAAGLVIFFFSVPCQGSVGQKGRSLGYVASSQKRVYC